MRDKRVADECAYEYGNRNQCENSILRRTDGKNRRQANKNVHMG